MCISGGKKCKFFGKCCVRAKWMIPKKEMVSLIYLISSILDQKVWVHFRKRRENFARFHDIFGDIVKHQESKQTKTKKGS